MYTIGVDKWFNEKRGPLYCTHLASRNGSMQNEDLFHRSPEFDTSRRIPHYRGWFDKRGEVFVDPQASNTGLGRPGTTLFRVRLVKAQAEQKDKIKCT